ncbi:glycosyltransferase [Nocardioides campestrisoli]|uniref:glycosyltransferase n=1 Tax=Nocardioides campestrisoli TaxID=2736757 RepID=UPI0015E7A959|nr:glycosyltransferase [Nocardioides campestrisoli]
MIGWYVHHQGAGHLHRMLTVTSRLDEEVTVLSSLPRAPGTPHRWLQLERDDLGDLTAERDVTAHGRLHWVPRGDKGLAERHAQVAAWVAVARPRLVVVDVSVEIALQLRLSGVPVVLMALPGERTDPAHTLAHDLAEALVAAWPAGLPSNWPPGWLERTTHVGALSRFDGRAPDGERRPGTAYLLWGSGGERSREELLAGLSAAVPDREWIGTEPTSDPDEVWHHLSTAEVVLTHAGQNAVAEVAAARAPAVVVADPRPFGEQDHTVQRLGLLDVALPLPAWPAPERWPGLLDEAVSRGGESWSRWHDGAGAERFAALLREVLDRLAGSGS